jgi:hypothetical protein
MAVLREEAVPDCVHPAVDQSEPPDLETVIDRPASKTKL